MVFDRIERLFAELGDHDVVSRWEHGVRARDFATGAVASLRRIADTGQCVNKKPTGRDSRTEPTPAGSPPEPTNYRVDRVFAPMPRQRPTTQSQPRQATQVASEILERTRTRSRTVPPSAATNAEAELTLRRELSRLQRQLSEAQRELANKDEELATEVEKRLAEVEAHAAREDEIRELHARIDELSAYEARTKGIEQRLADQVAAADELARAIEKEHSRTAAAEARVDELTRSFDETRTLWSTERKMLEDRANNEAAALEAKRKAAVDAGEETLTAATARLRESNEQQLTDLRAAHERSIQALRGELEPKVIEANSLAEERERLLHEITELKNEAVRVATEREEAHQRELLAQIETHASDQAQLARTHAAEVARITADKEAQIIAAQQEQRLSEGKVKTLEDTVEGQREALKPLQRELAELKEKVAALETDKRTLEDRQIAAGEAAATLLEQQSALREQVETQSSEIRRAAMDRMRFVAYLEEGLAMLGALPPTERDAGDAEITITRTATKDSAAE